MLLAGIRPGDVGRHPAELETICGISLIRHAFLSRLAISPKTFRPVALAKFPIGKSFGLIVATGTVALIGCRGRAQDDYYRQKLTNQIRVLEDQLYDADYQNRVLRDKLEQSRSPAPPVSLGADELPPEHSFDTERHRRVPEPVPDYDVMDLDSPTADDPPASDRPSDNSDLRTTDPPRSSPALPMPPVETPQSTQPLQDPDPIAVPEEDAVPLSPLDDSGKAPADENTAPDSGLGMPLENVPVPVPDADPNAVPNESGSLPPPTSPREQLLPPTPDQLPDDQIIPGDPKPPSEDPSAPGKIVLPPTIKTMSYETDETVSIAIPDRLELHPQLSGVHQTDQEDGVDGLYLVVTAVDRAGNVLSLDDYEIDAELNVVVIDPLDDSSDPRIGRWDFTPAEVRELVKATPIDGFHLPIAWQDRIPECEEVLVHVRLKAADEEMRCQGRVSLHKTVAVSQWLPR